MSTFTPGLEGLRAGRGEVAIEAVDVTIRRGEATILDQVSLAVHAGEVLALAGPNGAGKSTLLGALAGEPIEGGAVHLVGHPLREWRMLDAARRRAVMQQSNSVSFPFTVEQVVEMGRAPWQRTPAADRDDDIVAEALQRTEVTHLADRQFPSLSGGERARVALSRVLAQQAGVILLDEPTAPLDIRHQEAVLQLARERANDGDAVVVVLHDLNLAAAYADRVALLQQGRIRAVGSPAEVFTAELVSEVYQYPVEVIEHAGRRLVIPVRSA